jgi:hypothetical protein
MIQAIHHGDLNLHNLPYIADPTPSSTMETFFTLSQHLPYSTQLHTHTHTHTHTSSDPGPLVRPIFTPYISHTDINLPKRESLQYTQLHSSLCPSHPLTTPIPIQTSSSRSPLSKTLHIRHIERNDQNLCLLNTLVETAAGCREIGTDVQRSQRNHSACMRGTCMAEDQASSIGWTEEVPTSRSVASTMHGTISRVEDVHVHMQCGVVFVELKLVDLCMV